VWTCLAAIACKDGEGVLVRHLWFEGVRSVPEAELRMAVSTSGSSRLPWTPKVYFNRQEFNEDLKRLEQFYASHGFPEARVRGFRTAYNPTKTEMDLTVLIDEGLPTVVERVEFVGFDVLPAGHLDDLRGRTA
jgi:outer membrane protein assembly factor BamA